MTIETHQINGMKTAEVIAGNILIENPQDGMDLLADLYYQDFVALILYEHNLTPGFFDLKTGLAGEVLQKFSNYRLRLVVICDYTKYPAKNIQDFIYESNKRGHINFVPSLAAAKEKLSR